MSKLHVFKRALEIVSEGAEADVPGSLRTEALESFRKEKAWSSDPHIQGLGIGEIITGGVRTEQLSLRVYVDRKLPASQLEHPVPKTVYVPGYDEEIRTDVVAIGKVELESNTSRVRPAIPGFGVGHPDVSVGTFGCLVRKASPADRPRR